MKKLTLTILLAVSIMAGCKKEDSKPKCPTITAKTDRSTYIYNIGKVGAGSYYITTSDLLDHKITEIEFNRAKIGQEYCGL